MVSPIGTSFLKTMMNVGGSVTPVTAVASKKNSAVIESSEELKSSFLYDEQELNASSISAYSVVPAVNPSSLVSIQEYDASEDLEEDDVLNSEGQNKQNNNNVTADSGNDETSSNIELSEEEQDAVDELSQTDREVRRHEQAHAMTGGPYAGAPKYETEQGPDGKAYAVAGEVQIDTSPIKGDPEATIKKMDVVKRAALAPAQPSPEDRQVAMTAEQIKMQARQEMQQQETEEAVEEQSSGEFLTQPTNEQNAYITNMQSAAISAYSKASPLAATKDNGKVSYLNDNPKVDFVA